MQVSAGDGALRRHPPRLRTRQPANPWPTAHGGDVAGPKGRSVGTWAPTAAGVATCRKPAPSCHSWT